MRSHAAGAGWVLPPKDRSGGGKAKSGRGAAARTGLTSLDGFVRRAGAIAAGGAFFGSLLRAAVAGALEKTSEVAVEGVESGGGRWKRRGAAEVEGSGERGGRGEGVRHIE